MHIAKLATAGIRAGEQQHADGRAADQQQQCDGAGEKPANPDMPARARPGSATVFASRSRSVGAARSRDDAIPWRRFATLPRRGMFPTAASQNHHAGGWSGLRSSLREVIRERTADVGDGAGWQVQIDGL